MLIKLSTGQVIGKELNNGKRNLEFLCENCNTYFIANVTEGAKIYPPGIDALAYCECPVCHESVER